MKIVGVSFGGPEVTKPWVDEEKFGFEVWTDTDRTLARALGAIDEADAKYPKRRTYVLDAQARVLVQWESVNVLANPRDVLDDCTALFKPK